MSEVRVPSPPLWRRFWPDVSAERGTKEAVDFATLFAGVNFGFAVLVVASAGLPPLAALAYTALVAALVYAVHRRSRLATLAFLAVQAGVAIEQCLDGSINPLSWVFVVAAANGVRGAFAHAGRRRAAARLMAAEALGR